MNKAALLASTGLSAAVVMMAAASLDDMLAERDALLGDMQAIVDAADEAGEDLSEDDAAKVAEIDGKIKALDRRITARKAVEDAKSVPSAGRRTTPEIADRAPADGAGVRKVPATVRDNARFGFTNLGEFAMGVRLQAMGSRDEHESVKKLYAALTTYGNEGSGPDGGFLVPPEFARTIWQKVEAEENLMNRCALLTPAGNSITIPKDEATPWGTAGIRVYWDGEAATITQSKAAFELSTQRLHKLTALVPASDELLEDAPGYESFIMAKVPGIMAHTINDKIVDGTGVGMPLGILKSPSLITVSKATSQPADTVWFTNITAMWSRMYAPWRRNAIWLINQDIEPSLMGMAFQATGASSLLPGTSAVPAYMPMNGLSGSPYATLLGRPVVPLQACKTVGDVGDIILTDLQQYWAMRKASGVKVDTSIHLFFDQSVTAFRFVFRMNGQPAWSSAITPANSSNTLSWAVALAAR
jgi:HK97 family phage major capsid protein